MERQGAIDPSPDIRISDGLNRSKVFPREVVVTPFRESILQAASNVSIRSNERDTAGLFQGLKATQDSD
jgi:hypothetical protein